MKKNTYVSTSQLTVKLAKRTAENKTFHIVICVFLQLNVLLVLLFDFIKGMKKTQQPRKF